MMLVKLTRVEVGICTAIDGKLNRRRAITGGYSRAFYFALIFHRFDWNRAREVPHLFFLIIGGI